ncbi:hypothetical protein OIU84_010422 [Salix udensis]|uniref:Uncharacterized protein n=1 Tax=Salix udensis TaxID=889485 RepID=A0AAD6NVV1_9ROSI|nr:hypothetical protein OIU84_010422 [Salix udensis]
MKEELCMDTYKFGEIILEILTNGRLGNSGGSKQSKPKEVLLREIYSENQTGSADAMQEEIKLVFEVALLCMRSRPSDRPSMEDALKLLSGVKSQPYEQFFESAPSLLLHPAREEYSQKGVDGWYVK